MSESEITKEIEVREESEEEEWIGPTPSEATESSEPQPKKRKVLKYEKLFVEK